MNSKTTDQVSAIRSSYDNWFYGIFGAIVGSAIGYFCAKKVKNNREKKISIQEKKGGYVLWVTTHSKAQHQQVVTILKKHHVEHIRD